MATRNTIILAAGKGTRMKSKLYKVLHKVCGKTMVDHVLSQVEKLKMDNIITVVGYGAEKVEESIGRRTKYVLQEQQLGTGDAVGRTENLLKDINGTTLVVSGDTPLLTAETFDKLFDYHEQQQATATILTTIAPYPASYGRIVRNDLGIVEKIVEAKDANSEEIAINEINTGVYVFDNKALFSALKQVENNNAQEEFYLTDVIGIIKKQGDNVSAYQMADFEESIGVNDRVALSEANKIMQTRINKYHMYHGVTIDDPDNTYIDAGVEIGTDTIVEPGVQLKSGTIIGNNCIVGSHSKIINSKIHNHVKINSSVIEDSEMMDNSNIGPNSHLRPDSIIGKNVHIGNFCEVKKATIDEGTKMGHLSYVGNAQIGKNINIGCGVVFVNYDGKEKHQTVVGDNTFIGSNANLVSPLQIASHSFIAAGSTITDDLDEFDMGIARARQVNKAGYYKKLPYQKE